MELTKAHLVLSTGGVRCVSYAGAIAELEHNGIEIASVSACSAGSLVGALVCAGLSGEELKSEILKLEFKQFFGSKRFPFFWRFSYPFSEYKNSLVAEVWNIGFGKMMDMGSTGGAMMEDIDGTRHSFEGTTQSYYGGYSTYYGRTNDGSFVDYQANRSPSGLYSATAHLANGTIINYGAAFNGVLYPTLIKDRHGNYLTIAHQNNQGPRITTITDNLNRNITFNYDGSNRLVSITGPGFNPCFCSNVPPTVGQILKWNGSAWEPAAESGAGSPTTYTAGYGLNLQGTQFTALNTNAIWNADKIQGYPVAGRTAPAIG